jgi:hypothetical protein
MTTRQSYEMKDGSVLETAKHVDVAPENVDYSGATAKTDPKEIALVRKLDWWIMPILWLMYWLNYLVRTRLRLYHSLMRHGELTFFAIPGPQRNRSSPPKHPRRRPWSYSTTIPDLCRHFVRRLRYRRHSGQYGGYTCEAQHLDVLLHDCVGYHQLLDCCQPKLHRSAAHAILPRYHRGSVLPGSSVHPGNILHTQRASYADLYPLHW